MRRAAELIHIVPEEKEDYLRRYLNPSDSVAQILWICGIRKQYYYELDNLILRTYEYSGKNFYKDMAVLAENPQTHDFFVDKRRRDVPEAERENVNWWAPLKWLGNSLHSDPTPDEEEMPFNEWYHSIMSGKMDEEIDEKEYSYDEDDWSESVHM